MPYVDLAGLSRFAGKSKDFASSACAVPDMANWQRTAAAGAVSFLPVPEMPLDPVVNFLFSETGPASGTKSPDNPSTITGVTQEKVTRCGKNLIWTPWQDATTVTRDGITWTVNGDGTVTASGTATADSYFNVRQSTAGNRQHLDSGLTYVLSGCPASGSNTTYLLAFVCNSATFKDFGAGTTCSVNADDSGWISCIVRSGVTVSNLVFRPQLELGSAATSFEPYEGADYTVNLGDTYYGGSVDLSAGTMTVTWYGAKLTSASSFRGPFDIAQSGSNKRYVANLSHGSAPYTETNQVCSHYNYSHSFDANIQQVWVAANGSCYLYDSFTTLAELNAFLDSQNSNGTPVVVCYQLATPYTLQLTPLQIYSLSQPDPYTPRLNTVYSDQTSLRVGYPKSPQATQNELTNAVVSLGGNL